MYNQMNIYPDNLTGDLFLTDGNISRCYESEAVRQNVKQRLLTVQEEWFLNLDQGLPWFTELHGRNVPLELVRARVVECIVNTDGVRELISVDVYNESGRQLRIDFEYRDIYGNMQRIEF